MENKLLETTITFPDLSAASAPLDADIFPVTQSGTDKKQTFLETYNYINAKLQASGSYLLSSNNLSDLKSVSSARTNLGLGTAALENIAFFLQTGNNLSDIPSASTARSNLSINLQNSYTLSSSPQITGPLNLDDGSGNQFIFGDTSLKYAIYRTNTTVQGILPALLNTSQETTLLGNINSSYQGLEWYNTSLNVKSYFDGTQVQQLLTLDHCLPGSNMTLVDNGDGTLTFNSSGGGSGSTPSNSSFSIQSNVIGTTFAATDTFYPISAGSSFSNDLSADFVNEFVIISGRSTPAMRCISSTTKTYTINFGLGGRGLATGATAYVFSIFIQKADTSIVDSGAWIPVTLQDLMTFQSLPITTQAILSSGDRIFFQVKNITNTNSMVVNFMTATSSSMAGSIPNTDGLPQGTNNLYLSQDGGSTYQYLSGSATVGNIACFNTTGGQLIDLGISGSDPSFSTLTLLGGTPNTISIGTSTGALTNSNPVMLFSSNYQAGNYINIGGVGRNITVQNGGALDITWNADYDPVALSFNYSTNNPSSVFQLTTTGAFIFYTAPAGTAGNPVSFTTLFVLNNDGAPTFPFLAGIGGANASFVVSDGSGTLSSVTPDVLSIPYADSSGNILFFDFGFADSVISTDSSGNLINVVPGADAIIGTDNSGNIVGITSVPSSLFGTNSSGTVVSTQTIPSAVLSNITKVTTTILSSGSGTYTVPAGATHLHVRVWGSGGGGGGCATTSGASGGGSGGGGGGYAESWITSLSSSYSYSVDSGGSGGPLGANNGNPGGTTTFSTISVTGGAGGNGSTAGLTLTIGATAVGGVGSGAAFVMQGSSSFPNIVIGPGSSGTGSSYSGSGGSGAMGGAGGQGKHSSGVGANGTVPGGGGGGACITNGASSVSGGNGAAGLIIIEEYYVG